VTPGRSWAGYLKAFALAFAGLLGFVLVFIAAMNPFGNLPVHAFGPHVIMDTNDRYQYPAIVRSGQFDSAVIGTSSSRLLDPERLEQAFDGRFANLAMNNGRAWEQYQLTLLWLRTVPRPRTLLFGLDLAWCAADADTVRITERGFPAWIYDDNPWNDWLYLLNAPALATAARQLAHRLGLMRPEFPPNGFAVFVPPETAYDAGKAQRHIWSGPPRAITPLTPAYAPADAERSKWRYPALAWLAELLHKAPQGTRVILAFMPAHVAGQPRPGSQEAAREAECKRQAAALADATGAPVIDFRIASPITLADDHYWDFLHYRLPIAHRVVEDIARAVATAKDDPNGDWVVLRTGTPPR
jgi:hypothetical protein